MNKTFELEVEELGARENAVIIPVEVEYIWDNDGIGAYEYWGAKGFDSGVDYVNIEKATWDKTGFTPEEVAQVEKLIDKNLEDWAAEIEEEAANDFDEPDEPDFDFD